ncbi:MAG: T9SS type A sorting domain-containing protein [Bacteroidetes bacterium]|nr:T9SS type A sorting domain-containing protein [Bacteroidota bacterium]MBU1798339.1 T9SS type A sorting domain-containing protein [Bacteroidota bacterium]
MDGSNAVDPWEIYYPEFYKFRTYCSQPIMISENPSSHQVTIIDDLPPSAPQNLSIGVSNNHAVLSWAANTEADLKQYNVYRQIDGGSMTYLATTTNNSYTDNAMVIVPMNTFYYRVKAVDNNDNISGYSNQVSISGMLLKENNGEYALDSDSKVTDYELMSNYPNPFNPTTQISYQLPENSFVNLVVYNSLGQKVEELVNQHQSSGKYTVKFNAANLPSGVYIYKLQAGEFSNVKKMLLTK